MISVTEPDNQVYDQAYWDRYRAQADTEIGRKLTRSRIDLVDKFIGKSFCLDFGIGAGQFIEQRIIERGNTFGYDVMKPAVEWLKQHNRFVDPWNDTITHGLSLGVSRPERQRPMNVSMWDVLEHLAEPHSILDRIQGHLFISMPIYKSLEHVRTSKHFRPREHRWYFTDAGLRAWLWRYGFDCLWSGDPETQLGRESIMSYVFRRLPQGE